MNKRIFFPCPPDYNCFDINNMEEGELIQIVSHNEDLMAIIVTKYNTTHAISLSKTRCEYTKPEDKEENDTETQK